MTKHDEPRAGKYILEICEPRSESDVYTSFESESPFVGINKGDIVNVIGVGEPGSRKPVKVRVVEVEHFIAGDGRDLQRQVVRVLTEDVGVVKTGSQ
jgi:hypothetical protein